MTTERRHPDWIKVRAPTSPEYFRTKALLAELQAAYGLPGGVLPEYRRMLLASHGDLHADGRCVHAQLPLLRGRSRQGASARSRRAAANRARRSRGSACSTWSSRRSIATTCLTAARRISPRPLVAIKSSLAGDPRRSAGARLPGIARERRDRGRVAGRLSTTTISRRCRASTAKRGPAETIDRSLDVLAHAKDRQDRGKSSASANGAHDQGRHHARPGRRDGRS